MAKPILCLDFDGVIHCYESGWKGPDVIPDPPVPGAFAFIAAALASFRIAVFSSRTNQPGGLQAMQDWFTVQTEMGFKDRPEWVDEIEWPTEKPPAFLTIDDRAMTFTGEWPKIEALLDFKPWNKP